MQKAKWIYQHLSAYHTSEAAHQSVSPATGPPVPEPMQVDSTQLSREERTRRLSAGLCLYCAATDHYLGTCPIRPAVSTIQSEPVISPLSMLSVQLFTPVHSITASALVNSGSSGNFISKDLLSSLHLPHHRHAQELRVKTIQGKPHGCGHVRYEPPSVKLKIGGLHKEEITFLVL